MSEVATKPQTRLPKAIPRKPEFLIYFNTIPVANATNCNLMLMPCMYYLPANTGAGVVTCACAAIYCPDFTSWYYPTADANINPPSTGVFSYCDPNQIILTIYNPGTQATEERTFVAKAASANYFTFTSRLIRGNMARWVMTNPESPRSTRHFVM